MNDIPEWVLYLLVWGPLVFATLTFITVAWFSHLNYKLAKQNSKLVDNSTDFITEELERINDFVDIAEERQKRAVEKRFNPDMLSWDEILAAIVLKTKYRPGDTESYMYRNDDKYLLYLISLLTVMGQKSDRAFELVEIQDDSKDTQFLKLNTTLTEKVFIDLGEKTYVFAISPQTFANMKVFMQQQLFTTDRRHLESLIEKLEAEIAE